MAVFHGGNLAAAAKQFGIDQAHWVDLSTGINPHPYPIPSLATNLWARLPEENLLEALKGAAARYYGVETPEYVIPVSGTQTLLQILPHLFEKPKKVHIIAPTYNEHAYCWSLAGHTVREFEDIFEASQDSDVLIVVSPNNPTGDVYPPDFLLELAEKQHKRGGILIVDGAFMDCTPALDLSWAAGREGLVVLRSFGKFFGLAGLRLGFVLTGGELGQRLREGIGPWAVNGPALEIGRLALSDDDWIMATRKKLAEATLRLDALLTKGGLDVVGGTSLFRYCFSPNAQDIYQRLGENGILVRPFKERSGFLRFGLPGQEEQWLKLENALKIFS